MSPLSSESSPSPEKTVLPLHLNETWMRQFANRCKKELDLPALVHMEDEDFRRAATLFVNEYLVRKDARWDFPDGEEGIAAMQTLLSNALFFLGDEQSEPPANKINTFVRHAMYAYRGHVGAPKTAQTMDAQFSQRVANTTNARMKYPLDGERRIAYFQALSEFGVAAAPNILWHSRGKPSELQNHLGLLIAKINAASRELGQSGLNDATRDRVYAVMLVALEKIRQRNPRVFEGQLDAATKQIQADVSGAVQKIQKNDGGGQG